MHIANLRELRRHVVRIDSVAASPGDADDATGRTETLGTGCFVAPGWVLTAAHVVHGLDRVAVVPDRSVRDRPLTATVVARSATPAGTGLWPFPDLGLLHLDEGLDHPCALLATGGPAGDEDCHAWGFPPDRWAAGEDGTDAPDRQPGGSPVTFCFEGTEGNGFLKLKAGQAERGLSGAPLVCPTRRAVVGVISATRDPRTPLGAWATPASALLLGGGHGELSEHAERIAWENRVAVEKDREQRPYRSWDRVFAAEAAVPSWAILRQAHRFGRQFALLASLESMPPSVERSQEISRYKHWCRTHCDLSGVPFPSPEPVGDNRTDIIVFRIEQARQLQQMVSGGIGPPAGSAFGLGFRIGLTPETLPFLPADHRADSIRRLVDLTVQAGVPAGFIDPLAALAAAGADRRSSLSAALDANELISRWLEDQSTADPWTRRWQCALWRYATKAFLTAAGLANGADPEVVNSLFTKARGFGEELGLEPPALFTPSGDKIQDTVLAIHYILDELPEPAAGLCDERYGLSGRDLLWLASRVCGWLLWTDEDAGRALADGIEERCRSLLFPEALYREFVAALRDGAAFDQVKVLAQRFEDGVTRFLCGAGN